MTINSWPNRRLMVTAATLNTLMCVPPFFAYTRHATLVAMESHSPEPMLDLVPLYLSIPTLASTALAIILVRLYVAGATRPLTQCTRVKLENLALVLSCSAAGLSFAALAGMTYAYLLEAYFPLEPYYPMLVAYGLTFGILLAAIIVALIAMATKSSPISTST